MLAVHLVPEDYVRASKDTFTEAQAVIGILISSVGMHKFVLLPISSTIKIMNVSGFKHSQSCPAHTSRFLGLDQATATNVMLIC
ncbi:MAG: hypothetical protein MUO67_00705 [Anaerolineales bacterium]|nr:hypothetical protein [Anaerolineales bacterium]